MRTFGLFRLEILAALVNAVLLFASAIYVLIEAVIRLTRDDADVKAGPMLVVAILGLIVNIVVFMLLRAGARTTSRWRARTPTRSPTRPVRSG